ncbi:MAG: hypothetical protein AUH25_00200 [Thaumarchaeota archaeon 13_1_40CM_38_12]|nr:MAG: hypothetical protein AUH25_00200 [Thaumarchaeota archaeon 13_1_40CM_38_12]OLC35162.1 MAG: hypothetical protein AUH84_03720 [Thaumarchaeota archaeon 13_1_40CM_4_38_7]
MPFCTKCGHKLNDEDRFCYVCGTPITPPMETTRPEITNSEEKEHSATQTIGNSPVSNEKDTYSINYSPDRQTLFEDGILVLTPNDLILYSSDEKDELKRIPISIIEDSSYSMLSRGLVLKRRINQAENLTNYLEEIHNDITELEEETEELRDELKESDKEEKERLLTDLESSERELQEKRKELKKFEDHPAEAQLKQEELADIDKQVFRLPKDFSSKHSNKDEYKIWEYAVKRRVIGTSTLKVETFPYDAIVRIEGETVGTTPLTAELPLIDEVVLEGKYHLDVIKEGSEEVGFDIPTKLGESFKKVIELKERKVPDKSKDEFTRSLRKELPDRSVDLSGYLIEREVTGLNELLMLTKDTLLVMDKDRKNYLFEIPYGSIKEVEYSKGFFGSKSVKITYNEKDFKDELFEIWIDDKNGKVSTAEVKRHSESLVDFLNKKMKESNVVTAPMHKRSKDYYAIDEEDIKNNFRRFEPFEFEELVGKLFAAKGYRVEVTQKSGDYGVDVLAKAGHDIVAIQVKHWKLPVGGPDVHKTLGSMLTFGANRAIVVTTSDFTNQAYEIQKNTPIELWNGERVREEFKNHLINAVKHSRDFENN